VGGLGPQSSFRPAGAPTTGTPTTGTPATGTPATGTPATGTPATGTPAAGTPFARTPTTSRTSGTLPRTGAPALAGLAGLALLGTAALLRRRRVGSDAEL
jgi:LPXTG-motif cell wall-anchored protein